MKNNFCVLSLYHIFHNAQTPKTIFFDACK
nr:MAG TPA: hypothetical protein [Caudoviricetes sp.]